MKKEGNSATRAKNKYNTATYDQVKIWASKGDRDRFDVAAKRYGKSRNAFILEAIEEKIKRLEGEE